MAQTLTTENAIAWAARPEYVTAFTNDKTVLNIITYFLQWSKKEIHSENIKHSSESGMIQLCFQYNNQDLFEKLFVN